MMLHRVQQLRRTLQKIQQRGVMQHQTTLLLLTCLRQHCLPTLRQCETKQSARGRLETNGRVGLKRK
jgi:hypothetical protein